MKELFELLLQSKKSAEVHCIGGGIKPFSGYVVKYTDELLVIEVGFNIKTKYFIPIKNIIAIRVDDF